MTNLDELIKRVEQNYKNKDIKETKEIEINGKTYTVIMPSRSEKMELLFSSGQARKENVRDIYNWLRPMIYKMFQLKEVALKAKEQGYINTFLDVVDYVFEPNELYEIIKFVLNNIYSKNLIKEEALFQKK